MSQWKSQFDDSEETDNEWKGENLQSPEHRLSLHGISLVCNTSNTCYSICEYLIF